MCDCVVFLRNQQHMNLTHALSSCIRAADGLELMVLTVRQPFSKQQALMAQATYEYCTSWILMVECLSSQVTWSEGEATWHFDAFCIYYEEFFFQTGSPNSND